MFSVQHTKYFQQTTAIKITNINTYTTPISNQSEQLGTPYCLVFRVRSGEGFKTYFIELIHPYGNNSVAAIEIDTTSPDTIYPGGVCLWNIY